MSTSLSVKSNKNNPFKCGKKKGNHFRQNASQGLVDAFKMIQLCIKNVYVFFFISFNLDTQHIHTKHIHVHGSSF